LPPGVWYDYWTGGKIQTATKEKSDEATNLLIQPKLETLPVYVREGTILPLQPLAQSTEETPQGPLTLRVYPGKDCRGSLYEDDGKTMAYTRGEFLRIAFSCEVTSNGLVLRVGERQGSFHPWWSRIHVEVYGWDSPAASIRLKGKPSEPVASIDKTKHTLSVEIGDEILGGEMEIRALN
jgi:alpha-glucosidase